MDNVLISQEDTIFALASGLERAAIAIFRVSGPKSASLLKSLCGTLPKPRYASLRTIWNNYETKDDALDEALILWFPGPRSYTGQDSFEIHLHASAAIVESVSEACVAHGGRPAEPGEFTRRAFLNGRLDLIEAEGVADLIASQTQAQRRQALQQTHGALSKLYEGWRSELKEILAFSEALIDFSDEELPQEVEKNLRRRILHLIKEMQTHVGDGDYGRRIRRGVVVAIVGPPNVGKSTFLNWVSERDAAITSPIAGTTRDALEITTTISGVKTTFVDTAGLRETADIIELEGVKRAMFHVKHCDFVIQIFTPNAIPKEIFDNAILLGNKADLGPIPSIIEGQNVISVSLKNHIGLRELKDKLAKKIEKLVSSHSAMPYMNRARHRAAVVESIEHLGHSIEDLPEEIRCEELRLSMNALGRLTGRVNSEELLDSIFGEFCIGK